MKARVGKIARLPKEIREQLNTRLENGESGTLLVEWLNQLPDVQKIITEQFDGKLIRPQNLSDWRNGGYQDWVRHQLLREQTRWTTEQAGDLDSDIDSRTISISENVAFVISAELAVHVQALGAMTDPQKRFRQFRLLARELSRLRRDDQRALRNQIRREQWQSSLQPAEEESETETAEQPETPNPKLEILNLETSPESIPAAAAPEKISVDSSNSCEEPIPQSTNPSIPPAESAPVRDLGAIYWTAHPDRVPPPNYPV